MKGKEKHKQQKSTPAVRGRGPWWALAAVIMGSAAGIFYWGDRYTGDGENAASTPASESVKTDAEKDLLIGRWVRTDSNGGYTLEIKSASTDGRLEVGYYNPSPIHVGRAEWQRKDSDLVVVVELQDVNYPGSTYTLTLSKPDDRMIGTYYQAVEGKNFDVAFARIR